MQAQYSIKPKAELDIDEYARYLAVHASVDLALRFQESAHWTFKLLATQPSMGWRWRLRDARLKSLRVFRITGFELMLILYRPLAHGIDVLRVVHGSRNLAKLFRQRGEIGEV